MFGFTWKQLLVVAVVAIVAVKIAPKIPVINTL